MAEFLSKLLIVSNATDECENISRSNTRHLDSIPGLRVYKVLMVALPALNFVLNSVSFAVFRSLRRDNHFHGILMYLAASDALFQLVFGWLQLLLYLMESNLLTLPSLGAALLTAGSMSAIMYTATAMHLMRNWLVVLISYYRHRTTSGLQTGIGCLLSTPIWPKAVGFVAACLIVSLPRCFEFNVVTCAPMLQVTHIAGYLNDRLSYRIAYQGVVLLLIQSVGPLLLLGYFSIVLCRRVRRQNATRRTLSAALARNPQASCTRLVALLCAAFFVCETPTLAKAVDPMRERLHLLGYVCNLLVCVDSTLNCLIYGFTNRQFSQALGRRFRHCKAPAAADNNLIGMADLGRQRLLGNNGTGRQAETVGIVQDCGTSVHVMLPAASAPSTL